MPGLQAGFRRVVVVGAALSSVASLLLHADETTGEPESGELQKRNRYRRWCSALAENYLRQSVPRWRRGGGSRRRSRTRIVSSWVCFGLGFVICTQLVILVKLSSVARRTRDHFSRRGSPWSCSWSRRRLTTYLMIDSAMISQPSVLFLKSSFLRARPWKVSEA